MSRRPSPRIPRPTERVLQRLTPEGDDVLVREIETSVDLGLVVVIRRFGFPSVSIVQNGVNLFVRPHPMGEREPVGTYSDAATALRAGDRWAEATARGEAIGIDGGDNWPKGAA